MIEFLGGADESIFLHEMEHLFLMDLADIAKIDGVSTKELDLPYIQR